MSWGVSTDFILFAIPLFVLLGELLLRSGIAERMYGAMSQWLSWLPGGLMHSNIGTCTMFAAVSGSDRKSVASGKSVSVRVDLGGRSIIENKIRRKNTSSK